MADIPRDASILNGDYRRIQIPARYRAAKSRLASRFQELRSQLEEWTFDNRRLTDDINDFRQRAARLKAMQQR